MIYIYNGDMSSRMDVNDGKHKPFFWKVNVVTSAIYRGSFSIQIAVPFGLDPR